MHVELERLESERVRKRERQRGTRESIQAAIELLVQCEEGEESMTWRSVAAAAAVECHSIVGCQRRGKMREQSSRDSKVLLNSLDKEGFLPNSLTMMVEENWTGGAYN